MNQLYSEYLKTITRCPFCENPERIIVELEHAYITYSLAPYHQHHLLVIPKRHISSFFMASDAELKDINTLIVRGSRAIQKLGYENFSILLREGTDSAKSIEHLHYHIIPNTHLGDVDHYGNKRRLLSAAAVEKTKSEFASVMNKELDDFKE